MKKILSRPVWSVLAIACVAFILMVADRLIRASEDFRPSLLGSWYFVCRSAVVATLPLIAIPFAFRRFTRMVVIALFTWIFLFVTIEAFSYVTFGMVLWGDFILTAMATTWTEVREFVAETFSCKGLVGLGVVVAVWLLFVWTFCRMKWPYPRSRVLSFAIAAVLIGISMAMGFRPLAWAFVAVPVNFIENFDLYDDLEKTIRTPEIGTLDVSTKPGAVTVFVIGESATREHWQLYGYGRETTPYMARRAAAGELVVCTDLLAAWSNTQEALRLLLTHATLDEPQETKVMLPQLLHAGGVRSALISAQAPGGVHSSICAKLFTDCDERIYLESIRPRVSGFDECVLPCLDAILSQTNDAPIAVFVHLYGSHIPFQARFPVDASYFSSSNRTIQAFTTHEEWVNRYDDSVRYTDSVLEGIVRRLERSGRMALMAYLSDHGETPDAKGWRSFADPALWRVPFIVWTSEEYRKANPGEMAALCAVRDKPLQSDRLFDGFAHMAGVKSVGREKSDILSNSFAPPVSRKILNGTRVLKSGEKIAQPAAGGVSN